MVSPLPAAVVAERNEHQNTQKDKSCDAEELRELAGVANAHEDPCHQRCLSASDRHGYDDIPLSQVDGCHRGRNKRERDKRRPNGYQCPNFGNVYVSRMRLRG